MNYFKLSTLTTREREREREADAEGELEDKPGIRSQAINPKSSA